MLSVASNFLRASIIYRRQFPLTKPARSPRGFKPGSRDLREGFAVRAALRPSALPKQGGNQRPAGLLRESDRHTQAGMVVDDGIPLTPALRKLMGEMSVLPGRDINANTVVDADILLVRSITPITRGLLERSVVKFVATATAGHDHVDAQALADLGIDWAAAPGSNAISVLEYVLSALAETQWLRAVLEGASVGVVGFGEVGRRLAERLVAMGATVVAYDPFAVNWPSGIKRSDFEVVLQQPVVTLHASLTRAAPLAQHHRYSADADHAQGAG